MSDSTQPAPDATPNLITAQLSWPAGGGVVIGLPLVEGERPNAVTWDGSAATEDGQGFWVSALAQTTNTLEAAYDGATYENDDIPNGAPSARLRKV